MPYFPAMRFAPLAAWRYSFGHASTGALPLSYRPLKSYNSPGMLRVGLGIASLACGRQLNQT